MSDRCPVGQPVLPGCSIAILTLHPELGALAALSWPPRVTLKASSGLWGFDGCRRMDLKAAARSHPDGSAEVRGQNSARQRQSRLPAAMRSCAESSKNLREGYCRCRGRSEFIVRARIAGVVQALT